MKGLELFVLGPTAFLVALLALMGCSVTSEESTQSEALYFSCSGNVVIRALQNTRQNCQISIFDGKELITGRQLMRKDSAGWNYHGGDIAALLTDSTISVEFRNNVYEECYISQAEKDRREYSDTLFYITNTGALIRFMPKGDSAALVMSSGPSVIYRGTLPRVRSGSGEKYEEGNTMFWTRNNTAMLIHQGINYSHCIRMWPDEIAEDPCEKSDLDTFVRAFLYRELADEITSIPDQQRRYYAEEYDLNDDGEEEVLIALRSPYFCGTGGCTWYIASPDTTVFTRFTVSEFPIYVSQNFTNGYRDLFVFSGENYHMMTVTGNSYPSNPSVAPEVRLFSDPEYTDAGTIRLLSQAYIKDCPF